jgi:putative ATP-binding cassette transporter
MGRFKRLTSVFTPAAVKADAKPMRALSDASRSDLQQDSAMTPFSMRMAWRLITPYFKSEERVKAWGMLGATLSLAVSQVLVSIAVNDWWRQWMDTLPKHDIPHFLMRTAEAIPLGGLQMAAAVLGIYCGQAFVANWRAWALHQQTQDWLGRTPGSKPYFFMSTKYPGIDNPDQRITENLQKMIENTVNLGLGLFTNTVQMVGFAGVLWSMADKFNMASLGGPNFTIYHPLFLAAFAYGAYGIYQIRKIGQPLSALSARQQKFEADLRSALMNIRDNAPSIAALGGETIEKDILAEKTRLVIRNLWEVYRKNRHILMFNVPYQFGGKVTPVMVSAPLVLAGKASIGLIFQTVDAFANELTALSWYASIVPQIADWKASCSRVFEMQNANRALNEPSLTEEQPQNGPEPEKKPTPMTPQGPG